MKHVSILVPEYAVMSSLEDPRYLFQAVNQFLQNAGEEPLFDVHLVGLTKEVKLHEGTYTVHVNDLVEEVASTDLILLPALIGNMPEVLAANRDFVPWIVKQHQQGAEVASLCAGAFFLASTGLLNGKKCSTHWVFANQFREMFPEVELVDDKVITDENGIYSSGGANSLWNLLLYIIEKYTNREMAVLAAKYFAIEIDRNSQSPFIMFQGQSEHDDENIRAIQLFIERNYQQKLTVDDLCDRFAIARRSLERRFKKATHNTTVEYIQRVKIEAAKKDLEKTTKSVNEVMFDVGYADTKAFRNVFKKITGLTPVEYRNKFNKEAAVWV
ncbi:MAG: helix-turn-helix domain-containing protein [Bacteroidota bacterium]